MHLTAPGIKFNFPSNLPLNTTTASRPQLLQCLGHLLWLSPLATTSQSEPFHLVASVILRYSAQLSHLSPKRLRTSLDPVCKPPVILFNTAPSILDVSTHPSDSTLYQQQYRPSSSARPHPEIPRLLVPEVTAGPSTGLFPSARFEGLPGNG
ncbi:hypothetical protein NP233_g9896 [Leucocoprinus birnbaumii]|uniref:Uncharacterized protein n=1 Tax=Leucocoprinus birnbaumii TaxID=56174 RepID=A0AAD5VJC5_9AGAR|nr:hypothetical protein NP233_g9896 [Leucocoprinus birnbaumii]